jgi:hypothetical protein
MKRKSVEEHKKMINYRQSTFCGCCKNRKMFSSICEILNAQILSNHTCDYWVPMEQNSLKAKP